MLPRPLQHYWPNSHGLFFPSAVLNGSSHSPTSLNGAPSTPNGFSNGPAMSSTASLSNQQLPPACGARQLCKLKRFLTTLQQFGNDISPEIGERVRSLVLGLVVSSHFIMGDYCNGSVRKCYKFFLLCFLGQNSTLTIEEFHSKLHEATNFPLRPFVIPFLKVNDFVQILYKINQVWCLNLRSMEFTSPVHMASVQDCVFVHICRSWHLWSFLYCFTKVHREGERETLHTHTPIGVYYVDNGMMCLRVSIKSGVCKCVRPPGVWWSSTSGTLQL